MRTFVIKARKGTTRWDQLRSHLGTKAHIEVIVHSIINAFFMANDFRMDVEVYIILDSSADFPHTIKLSATDGLSLGGFHEEAIIQLIEHALKNSLGLRKDQTKIIAPGVSITGFGFEKLISQLIQTRSLYLLDKKGEHIKRMIIDPNPVFILSDHLSMPKKTMHGLKRHGVKPISLGNKMLFASQCIVLINYEMDMTII